MKRIPFCLLALVAVFLSACQQSPKQAGVKLTKNLETEENAQLSYQQAVKREQAIAKNDVWHAAKLKGVSFRAVGQEPAWLMEIYPGDKIFLSRDYGDKADFFNYLTPKVEQAKRRSIFTLEQQGTVTIEGKPCSDSMSGESFEATVTVTIKGKTLKGCGRALF